MARSVAVSRPRLILSALTLLASLLFAGPASAQPGNEGASIRIRVNSLEQLIDEAGKHIKAGTRDARRYEERGSLYADLYRVLYRSPYGLAYGPTKPPELSVATLTAKAVEDFSRAIRLAPSLELFQKRAEMYEARWDDTVTRMMLGEWIELNARRHDLWASLTETPPEKSELEAFGRLVNDPDFAASAADYSEALRLGKDPRLIKALHAESARLYLSRTRAFPLEFQTVRKWVNGPNQFGYSIWADFEKALKHFSETDRDEEVKLVEPDWGWVWPRGISRSRTYFEKATLAAGYGRYEEALKALNMAEKYFEPDRHFLGYTECEIHGERSRLYVKLSRFDEAIADATGEDKQAAFCDKTNEPRGDAYFAKGEWRAAVADYTAVMDDSYRNKSFSAFRNRALAYAHLGEAEKAIEVLKFYLDGTDWPREPEDYRLRAQLYRQTGRQELASADEKSAEQMVKQAAEPKVEKVYVLVELKLREGMSFNLRDLVMVEFIDAADPERILRTTAGIDGRFIESYEKGRSFKIYVLYDGVVDGRPVRFSGYTEKLTADGTVGPVTIMLDHFVWKDK